MRRGGGVSWLLLSDAIFFLFPFLPRPSCHTPSLGFVISFLCSNNPPLPCVTACRHTHTSRQAGLVLRPALLAVRKLPVLLSSWDHRPFMWPRKEPIKPNTAGSSPVASHRRRRCSKGASTWHILTRAPPSDPSFTLGMDLAVCAYPLKRPVIAHSLEPGGREVFFHRYF